MKMQAEKILILLGIGLLLYAFLQQPATQASPQWMSFITWQKPGTLEVKARAIMSENIDKVILVVDKVQVLKPDGTWQDAVSGSKKLNLGSLVEQELSLETVKIEPGTYSIISVSVTGVESYDLAGRKTVYRILEGEETVEIEYPLVIEENQLTSITLLFDTRSSMNKNFFKPKIEVS